MNKLTLIAVAASLAAPAAYAGGLAQPVPEPVIVAPAPVVVKPAGNWEGQYAGIQLGYGDFTAKTGNADYDGSGTVGGIHYGYRWDLGTTVLGMELDYNGGNISNDRLNADLDSLTRLKLQAGYDFGRTLVYATAGAAHAKASVGGGNYKQTGWTAGLGVDYAINDRWTVGGEALYNKFDDFDGSGVDLSGTTLQIKTAFHF